MKLESIFSNNDDRQKTVPAVSNETAEYANLSADEIAALATGAYQQFRDLERLISACARGMKLAEERTEQGYEEVGNVEEFFTQFAKSPSEVDEVVQDALKRAEQKSKVMSRKSSVFRSIMDDLTKQVDEMTEKKPFLHELWKKDDGKIYAGLGFNVESPESELAKKLEQLIAEKKSEQKNDRMLDSNMPEEIAS